jgi:hypothetical protein
MINDLQKIVRSSQTEVEMLKEKCEKYVSVKIVLWMNISQGDSTFDTTLIGTLNGGKYNTMIMYLGSLKFHVK